MYDLLLSNARIVDGTGNPWFKGDVGIENGKITAIGDLTGAPTKRTLNVDGKVLAPGFIDLHSHSDFTTAIFPRAESMVRQGVTTELVGNCGLSPFPIEPSHFELLQTYTGFIDCGLTWEWQDAAGFMASLENLPLASNLALQVGHGTIRIAVMGFDDREPTATELAAMEKLVAQAHEQGVFGLSSGLIYVPGSYAQTAELVALAKVSARYGGFYSSHIRGEGDTLLEAVAEAITIGREAGTGVQLSHHKASGKANWGQVENSLQMIDAARAAGYDVLADQYPYTAGGTTLTALLPQWAIAGGVEAMRKRLADSATHARIYQAIANADPDTGARQFSPETIMISGVPEGPNKAYQGLMLSEIAAQRQQDMIETALYLLESEPEGIGMIVFTMSEDDVRRVMRHPAVAVGTDGANINPSHGGSSHPRNYGTFPRVLGKYVREEHVLSLPEAIRKMTSLPAQRLRRFDMGLVRPGCIADLVIFDPDTVQDRATFPEPHQYARGISHVLVNGTLVIEEGEDTGAKAGRVLRRGE